MQTFLHGFLVGGSLIVVIGAQNAFVLKQGLLKQHVFLVCCVCFLCDFLLMSFGVLGLANLIHQKPIISLALAILGFLFLFTYGVKSFLSAYRGNSHLHLTDENRTHSRTHTLLSVLAITLLNPHVYLDTVVIVGGVASTLTLSEKYLFLTGTILASFLWFFGLGYGARLLAPLFDKPKTWRILDILIGVIMWFIGFGLLRYAYQLVYNLSL